MSGYVSLGGKYAGVITKKLQNGSTAFYILFRDFESKAKRKKVGSSPDMTKAKALLLLNQMKEEIRAKKELSENPNSPIPDILRKKVDKKLYTLNDLADYYFFESRVRSKREMQNKYNYHFGNEPLANKNINLISEDDVEDYIKRKGNQRADNRRSNSGNITRLHEQVSAPKRKRKSRAANLTLEEREASDYDKNHIEISKLESILEAEPENWRISNRLKLLKEKNKVLSYRIFPEAAQLLLKDKTLDVDKMNSLLGVLSRKSVKETLLLASTIVTYANRHKKLNIINQFNIIRGDKLYIKVNNVKPRYLTKEEIKNYLAEVKSVTENNPEKHNYLYLISLLALSTAARRDTILSIRIEDIDLENDNLQLRNFKTESNFTSTISNPTIKSEIIRIIDNRPASSFLFENSATGLRISTFPPKMKEILDYTVNCHKSYLNHLTIKEFRNTVASHLAMNGSSLPQIAQVLNHTSVRSTEIYTQLRPSTAKDKVADFVSEYLD